MSAFAKACADISNNLRNFRFSKSSSSSSSPTNQSSVNTPTGNAKEDFTAAFSSNINNNSHSSIPSPTGPLPNFIMNTNSNPISPKGSPTISRSNVSGVTVAAIKQRLFSQGLKIEVSPKKKKRTRYRDYAKDNFNKRYMEFSALWNNKDFMLQFFQYFTVRDLCTLCLVCKTWNDLIVSMKFWNKIKLTINFKQYVNCDNDSDLLLRLTDLFETIKNRGVSYVTLENASDQQISLFTHEIVQKNLHKQIVHLNLRCTSITDKVLQKITESFTNLNNLELFCCNDLSEVSLWSSLVPNITTLTLWDCINISDESIGAVTQLLPNLIEFNLQAYHVTDMAFTYFNAKQFNNLKTLGVVQCMDITNQGVINIAHSLPNLRNLNLSGISKLTDDGLDVVCESMKHLVYLDLSWCPKLTDSGLECVACDLTLLEELVLDRCPAITDNGINYLSTMSNLAKLSLRWCTGISDLSLSFLLSMTNLQYLSIAGCKRLTEDGISTLIRHPNLRKLEVTHCRINTDRVRQYFLTHMSHCVLID